MESRNKGLCLAILASVLLLFGAIAQASEITDLYINALEKNDQATLRGIIKYKKDVIPAEIKAFIEQAKAPDVTDEHKEYIFYVAELMARDYRDVTGDVGPLLEVKKRSFDARLDAPVTPPLTDGARIVNIPKASEDVKNVFMPDNIVVKLGDTVRWTNSDDIAHVFATMSAISAGRFSVSSIPPGGSWEFKFEKPGEYFYICFIHQSMIGKVTVEGPSDAPEAAKESAPPAKPTPDVSAAPEKAAEPAAAPEKTDEAGVESAPDTLAPAAPTIMQTTPVE